MSTPLIYSDSVEVVTPEEAENVREILAMMAKTQRANSDRHRHAIRDAHAKSHAILKATVTVQERLPKRLAQGIFSEPRTYDALVRLSSAPGDIHSDEIPAPRGFATKFIGVSGDRLVPTIGGSNQDFLMVNFPALAFGTVAKYRQMLGLLEANSRAPEVFQKLVARAARVTENVVEALGGEPGATLQGVARDNSHLLGETFHTQAAIRYGDHIAKLSLAPKSDSVRALTGNPVNIDSYSTMMVVVCDFFRSNRAEYELRAQLCTDLALMPVEDAGVQWDEALAPHEVIATLTIPQQNASSPARRIYGDDVLSFNPWNGVQVHRPLGSIMRIRKPAYERSTAFRHAENAIARHEPDSLSLVPD